MGDALTGSCLCGGVRYEITGPFRRAGHCHCSRCRKHSGAAAGTQGRVLQEHFRLTQGGILLRTYARMLALFPDEERETLHSFQNELGRLDLTHGAGQR